jgi:threonylcarbamoyladenosine tRNA methylthiotransferase MtaB
VRYSIVTFGCRVNQADSFKLESDLRRRGGVAAPVEEADLVIVNTCSVTATADQGARQTIRRIARQNDRARIVVTGCYASRAPEQVASLPGVVRLIRNVEKDDWLGAIEASFTTSERFGEGEGACGAAIEPGVMGRTAYLLRVQTGCDEVCSYCIIPSTRGRGVSRPIETVRREVERAIDAGYKEIVVTGVHLGSYGRDLTPASSLVSLLTALNDIRPGRRLLFRVSSLEPMDCTSEVVDLMASAPRFAPHFHLPLQHASHRMLKAMRRPYTLAFYAALVERIRDRLPHAAIGSDVIVGFPGEEAWDSAQTVDYLRRSPLTYLHVFPYSDRPGTPASSLRPKVSGTDIRERSRAIQEVGRRLSSAFLAAHVGSVRRGLTLEDGSLVVTDNFLKVRIPPGRVRNEWVDVRILEGGASTRGSLASEP